MNSSGVANAAPFSFALLRDQEETKRPSWMTAALHTPQDSGVRRTLSRGLLVTPNHERPTPLRGTLFFCLLFFWARKRKVRLNKRKIFLSPKSTTRPSIEDGFCVPTLEKEGSHGANSAGTPRTGGRNVRIMSDQRPCEGPFSFAYFLLGTQKKSKAQQTKNFSQPEEHDAPKH